MCIAQIKKEIIWDIDRLIEELSMGIGRMTCLTVNDSVFRAVRDSRYHRLASVVCRRVSNYYWSTCFEDKYKWVSEDGNIGNVFIFDVTPTQIKLLRVKALRQLKKEILEEELIEFFIQPQTKLRIILRSIKAHGWVGAFRKGFKL